MRAVTSGLCNTHDLPHPVPFTLEIKTFLPEAQASNLFTRSNLFTLCPWMPLCQQTHVQVADGSVTQPRFGSGEEARGELRQEKEARLHGVHEGSRALI